jgi:hypothetical protein
MPIIGFSVLGIGGLFIYAGYLGYTPAEIIKAMLDGKLTDLPKIPIDPRKRTTTTTTSPDTLTPSGQGTRADYHPPKKPKNKKPATVQT